MNFRFFFFFAFLFLTNICLAGKITGLAPDYPGERVLLLGEKDPVSRAVVILDEDTVDSEGNFEFYYTHGNVQFLTIYLDNIKGYFFSEPNQDYEIEFPPLPPGMPRTINNTNQVVLLIKPSSPNDINELLSEFISRYATFIDSTYHLTGSRAMKERVAAFENHITSDLLPSDNPYFNDYVKFRMAGLKIGNGWSNLSIYEKYIKDQDLDFSNEGVLIFLESFYSNYFKNFRVKFGEENLNRALTEGNWPLLEEVLDRDDFLKQKDLKKIITLISLRDQFGSGEIPSVSAIKLLGEIEKEDTTHISIWAGHLREELTRGFPGTFAPLVNVQNEKEEVVQLPNKPEKDLLLIEFVANWCTSCKLESNVVTSIQKRYEDILEVYSVVIEDDKDGYSSFRDKTYPAREVFYAAESFEVRQSYRITRLPFYVLLDQEGRIINTSEMLPSGDLDRLIYNLSVSFREKPTKKVGEK